RSVPSTHRAFSWNRIPSTRPDALPWKSSLQGSRTYRRKLTGFSPETLIRPHPLRRFRLINAILMRVIPALDLLIQESLLRVPSDSRESGDGVHNIHRQAEAVDVVVDRQLQRRVDTAFLFVSPHVNVAVIRAPVGEPMNQLRIPVKVEQDRLVDGKQGIEVVV